MTQNWKISAYSTGGGNCVEAQGPWRKSSSSVTQETCVEVAGPWHTSSYSDMQGDQCVEISSGAVVRVRDSKDRSRPYFAVGAGSWAAFVASLRT